MSGGIPCSIKYRCKCGTRGELIWAYSHEELELFKAEKKAGTVLCETCEQKAKRKAAA